MRYFFGGEDVDGKENVDRFLAESYRKPASGSVLALASLVIKPQALGLNRIDARTGGGNCRYLLTSSNFWGVSGIHNFAGYFPIKRYFSLTQERTRTNSVTLVQHRCPTPSCQFPLHWPELGLTNLIRVGLGATIALNAIYNLHHL